VWESLSFRPGAEVESELDILRSKLIILVGRSLTEGRLPNFKASEMTGMRGICLFVFILGLVGCQTAAPEKDPEILQLQKDFEKFKKETKDTVSLTIRNEILPELREIQLGHRRAFGKKQLNIKKNIRKKIIIGRVEWITLVAPDIPLRARVDTGAQTCSLHAESITEKEIDGERYVEFTTIDEKGKPHRLMKKVVEETRVRSTSGRSEKRYVVEMTLRFGEKKMTVGVNLNNRKKLRHRFLVGRNLLLGQYVVDVSQSRVLGEIK
jgi:ribosomal protein S6--L-glutamate ligase